MELDWDIWMCPACRKETEDLDMERWTNLWEEVLGIEEEEKETVKN